MENSAIAELDSALDFEDDLSQLLNKNSKKKHSGGFQSMGLDKLVLRGVLRKGYKVPTPIQRKTIPTILEGKDIVAMARTGSGKTAAFLVPLFQRLKTRSAKAGARALIFSPTRELAQQTMKFTKELGRFTDLRTAIVLGGDKLDNQFAAMHDSPDILIATPGRFLHIVMEMDLKLQSLEYVVFDEADRLFEMGFQDQLQEILHRLPDNRQTLLFSATLPKLLVDFAKAGLNDPVLIRLDTESKLSEKLKAVYLHCRSDEKLSVLLHLLTTTVGPNEMTVVFLATKHHVEYVRSVLEEASIVCAYVYSSLDPAARKIQVAKFHAKKARVLLVTDVAARGIDIPLLDNVINYNFPAKPKLYVHRVGRVARAGRSGIAYSIVSYDETPYLLDLHLFLGRGLTLARSSKKEESEVFGSLPQHIIDEEADQLSMWHDKLIELKNLLGVSNNAYKQYLKSRPVASTESTRRVKDMFSKSLGIHPLYKKENNKSDSGDLRIKLLEEIKCYRPNNTIFEIGNTAKNQASEVMRLKKAYHKKAIENNRALKIAEQLEEKELVKSFKLKSIKEEDILKAFPNAKSKVKNLLEKNAYRDEDNFLHYQSIDHHTEKGFEMDKSFDRQAAKEVLEIAGDDASLSRQSKNVTKWDRKKKKYVNETGGLEAKKKKIRTESGAWIPATYKSNAYNLWKEKTKFEQQQEKQQEDENSEDDGGQFQKKPFKNAPFKNAPFNVKKQNSFKSGSSKNVGPVGKWGKKRGGKPAKRELKSKDEILKMRTRRDRLQEHAQKTQTQSKMKKKTKLKRGLM